MLDNLHLIANGKFDLLKRRSGCADAEISEIFKIIKSFNPKPGLKFEMDDIPIREPDLSVKATADGWIVELNNSTLPAVKIEKEYAQVVRKKVVEKKRQRVYPRKNFRSKMVSKGH